jgi:hypothetical protein
LDYLDHQRDMSSDPRDHQLAHASRFAGVENILGILRPVPVLFIGAHPASFRCIAFFPRDPSQIRACTGGPRMAFTSRNIVSATTHSSLGAMYSSGNCETTNVCPVTD